MSKRAIVLSSVHTFSFVHSAETRIQSGRQRRQNEYSSGLVRRTHVSSKEKPSRVLKISFHPRHLASSSFCISRARAPFCRAIDMALERVKSHFENDGEKALFLALRVQNRQRLVIVRRYKILTLKKVENSWKFAGGSCVRGIFNAESKNRERKNVNKT